MTSVSQTGATGGNGVAAKTVTFGYNVGNQLTSVDSYAAAYGGIASGNEVDSAAYTYDDDLRLTDLKYTGTSDATLAAYHWDYNDIGLVTDEFSRNDSSSGSPDSTYTSGSSNWGKTSYTYDHTGQLAGTSYSDFAHAPSSNTSATFDTNGNRTDAGSAGAGNRLLTDGIYDFTYDAAGNRIARTNISTLAVTYYTFNNANELTAVSGSGGDATFSYDAFARMVSQTEDSTTENFIYNGDNIALVLNSGGQVIDRDLYAAGVDQILATERVAPVESGTQAAGTVNWLLTDNQGTVRDVAQYSSGTTSIVDQLIYDSFGQLSGQVASGSYTAGLTQLSVTPQVGYDGMQFDFVTGLRKRGVRPTLDVS